MFLPEVPTSGLPVKTEQDPREPWRGSQPPGRWSPSSHSRKETQGSHKASAPCPPHPSRVGHPSGSVSLPSTPTFQTPGCSFPTPPQGGGARGRERHIFTCFLFSSLMILSFLPLNTFNGTEATTLSPKTCGRNQYSFHEA